MSVILENKFVEGNSYSLTTLPRKGNGIWTHIPELTLNDKFIFTGEFEGHSAIMRHTRTGISFPLKLFLFIDSGRFYYTLKDDRKTALFVLSPTRITLFGDRKKSHKIEAGVIFDIVENTAYGFLVKAQDGKMYDISNSAVVRLVDIDKEYAKTEEVHVSPVISEANVPVVQEIKEEPLGFKRSIILNDLEFSSSRDADLAEELVTKVSLIINSLEFSTTKDAENALKLARQMGVM